MKTRKMTFLQGLKRIVTNQRGSIGDMEFPVESEAAPEAVAEEVAEEAIEVAPEAVEGEEVVEVAAETEAELEEEIQDAIEDGASEEEVKNMIRQFTLKVDGKEFVKEIDLNDEDALTKQFQLAAKGQQSMQELQELKNAYSHELKRIMSDPLKVLQELDPNFDPLDISAKYIDELTKANEMSPEQKAELENKREFEAMKEERDRLKQEAQDRQNDIERTALAEEIQTDIMAVLSEDDELVADRETVALVAENLMRAANNNMHDITAKDVIPTVKEQLRNNFQKAAARFKTTSALKQYMGKDLTDKLREERVEQAKKQVSNVNSIKKDVAASKTESKERKKVPLSSLFK
jgi:hypothetical protein